MARFGRRQPFPPIIKRPIAAVEDAGENTGALSPSAAVDQGGFGPWSDTANVYSSDNAYATAAGDEDFGITNYLLVSEFGAAVPDGATIDGVKVEIECKISSGTANVQVLLWDGVLYSLEKTFTITTSEQYHVLGGAADVWGGSLTSALVNDDAFGVNFRVSSMNTSSVDHVRITVYYTGGASGQSATKRKGGVMFAAGAFRHCHGVKGW